MEPRSFLGKGTDRSEPQRRQQDDNWGPERIMLTKKPLKVARMYKRMQENITLARTRIVFKTYEHFFQLEFFFNFFCFTNGHVPVHILIKIMI